LPQGLNADFLPREALERLGFRSLGHDVLIHATVVIVDCAKISLGSRVRIDPYVVISTRGGVEFGDNIHVGSHCVLAGASAVHIGDFVNISHHVGIYTTNEDVSGRTLSHPTVGSSRARTASIVFERHVMVGAGSLVLPGARLGEGAILGAMSRTARPLRPWSIYSGVPARKTSERRRDVLARADAYLEATAGLRPPP
jgi:acetyltransferase-like isoleucine patch superfamily enzyme